MSDESKKEEHTWIEVIDVYAKDLVDRVKELIKAGNVRRLIIRKPGGNVLLEIPLTAGVAVGSVMTLFAPVLAAVGAMAALLTMVKIEVVRVKGKNED
ncbi:DUF4342 domain-containing protein [candidate division TA06 bacterium]|uniref:DUF4342 domain-containing protein n=1 Tax=candidate division TA06 bacterium TaxID=2250710 RepID=A0A523UTF4_UNCT6|nr:MAG: DUF4342 domain-containing protein [candidate division TA06 bacterium]